MAAAADERLARELAAKAEALALVNDHARWAAGGPWLASTGLLLEALARVSAAQPAFELVDAGVPFAARAARLVAWCASHPQYSSAPIELCASLPGKPPGTRGVTAAAPLAQGAPVVCVPAALALSTDSAYLSWELGPLLDQQKLGLHQPALASSLLGIHLLVEHAKAAATPLPAPPAGADAAHVPLPATAPTGRSPADIARDVAAVAALGPEGLLTSRLRPDAHPWGSPWRAFLACLPARVPNCAFWSARHFASLAHTRVAYASARFLRDLAKVYLTLSDSLVQAVEGLAPHFTWEAFRWAQACCMSRQNMLPSLPGTPRPATRAAANTTMALLPIFDMLNHDPREGMPYFTEGPGGGGGVVTACLTAAPAPAGAELCMNYGPRAAGELLMHQGFLTPPSLAGDAALLTLAPPPAFAPKADALFAIKTGLLERLGVHWSVQGRQHLAALAASRGEPLQVAAGRMREEAKWALPLDFPLRSSASASGRGGGGAGAVLSPQAWTLARVLCLERKDAAAALRAAQEAIVRAEEGVRRREAAEAAAAAEGGGGCCAGEEEGGGSGSGGGGHSHGGGGSSSSSSSSSSSGGGTAAALAAAAPPAAAGHGHSHDGGATQCSSSHGHGHGGSGAAAPAAAGHGHSHDGGATQCSSSHGHGHGGSGAAAPAPAAAAAAAAAPSAAAAAGHGHSHDGGATQCHGSHGHGHGGSGHGAHGGSAALHGHSHDGGVTQCQGSHGHGAAGAAGGAAAAAAAQQGLCLPEVSAANELAARAFLAQHLRVLDALAQDARSAAAAQPEELAEDHFVNAYLESQAGLIARALQEVQG